MPSFDMVSEVDMHEVTNACDQARRDLNTRWDFKNVDAGFELVDKKVRLAAEQDFQLEQMEDMLRMAFAKRKLDSRSLVKAEESKAGKQVRQDFSIQQGIDQPTARKIVKMVKEQKLKVQVSIQGEKVRVNGKKRDDLQQVMALVKESDIDIPIQFNNFRD
ncbi:MAG: YajQ family cyclic di-GMP-binding protein [Proteobacteria bacterium]|nr:MAG: YajQ family cyclic di-GMP-binding protein [Pseudomonadota bacterium]PIE40206.1 MAG: YajQ family cyclic di-GMP-binding protein [Gammaproteobacteria bacterium]